MWLCVGGVYVCGGICVVCVGGCMCVCVGCVCVWLCVGVYVYVYGCVCVWGECMCVVVCVGGVCVWLCVIGGMSISIKPSYMENGFPLGNVEQRTLRTVFSLDVHGGDFCNLTPTLVT